MSRTITDDMVMSNNQTLFMQDAQSFLRRNLHFGGGFATGLLLRAFCFGRDFFC
jgi:hypothetical protein